jgi:hypothetical protein
MEASAIWILTYPDGLGLHQEECHWGKWPSFHCSSVILLWGVAATPAGCLHATLEAWPNFLSIPVYAAVWRKHGASTMLKDVAVFWVLMWRGWSLRVLLCFLGHMCVYMCTFRRIQSVLSCHHDISWGWDEVTFDKSLNLGSFLLPH